MKRHFRLFAMQTKLRIFKHGHGSTKTKCRQLSVHEALHFLDFLLVLFEPFVGGLAHPLVDCCLADAVSHLPTMKRHFRLFAMQTKLRIFKHGHGSTKTNPLVDCCLADAELEGANCLCHLCNLSITLSCRHLVLVEKMQRLMEENKMVSECKIRQLQTENDALRMHLKLADAELEGANCLCHLCNLSITLSCRHLVLVDPCQEYQQKVEKMQRLMEENKMVSECKIRQLQTENDALDHDWVVDSHPPRT
jgi:hypothetical protein